MPMFALVFSFTNYSISQDLDDTSLTPPIPILDHVQILREIMAVYQSSLGDEDKDNEDVVPEGKAQSGAENETQYAKDASGAGIGPGSGFLKIGDVMVRPAVDMCLNAAEAKKTLRPGWDMDVFILNCLSYLLVSRFRFAPGLALPLSSCAFYILVLTLTAL